jgi:hypothetical protein
MSGGLIYTPARRDKVGLIIGMSGPSGAGKTYSALRLARGLVGPTGQIALLDTENKRALTYADDFEFDHGDLGEPFSPERYAEGAAMAMRSGYGALIIDSMSHEHAGPGGVLEMHEDELTRLTKGSTDYAYRDSMKMVAWIKPKMQHKAMVQRLLQLNSHIIMCFRAEEKTEIQLLKNKVGKLVNTPVSIGFQPITAKDMAYEMTILLGFDPKQPGVPVPIKLADKFKPYVPLDRLMGEETGERLAAWARGEKPSGQQRAASGQLAGSGQRVAGGSGQPAGSEHSLSSETSESPAKLKSAVDEPPFEVGHDTQPGAPGAPTGSDFPGDRPDEQDARASAGGQLLDGIDPEEAKISAGVLALVHRFEAVKVRADHLAIVDVPENRDRISWIKKHRKDLAEPLKAAMEASWARTQQARPGATAA